MSDPVDRAWHFYLDDMIRFAEKVASYTKGFDPSTSIIATRNRLIHGYLGIDDDTLWSIVETDIPALLLALRSLRKAVV